MPAGRCTEELKLHLRRTAPRAVRAYVRAIYQAWLAPSRHRRTHLRPVWWLIPYVRLNPATSWRPPARQSSMNLLRSSTGPVSSQRILEATIIR